MAQAATDEFSQYEVKAPPSAPADDEFSQYEVGGDKTTPPPATTHPAELGGYTGLNAIGQGVKTGLKSIVQGTMEAMKPRSEDEVQYGPAGRLLKHSAEDLYAGLVAGKAARDKAAAQGEGVPGQILATMENYPIIGHAVKKIEEGGPHMFSPQSVEGASELGTMVAAPKIAGDVGGAALKATGDAILGAPEALRSTAQGVLDIGPELTQRAVEKATASYADDLAERNAKQAAETEKTATKNAAKIEKYETAKTDVARQNEEAKMQHAADTQAVMERNEAAQNLATKRGQLADEIRTGSQQLGEGIKNLRDQVKAQADQNYAEVRKAVANDPGETPESVIEAVKHARKNIIKGTEESTREFNSILRKEVPEEDTAAIDAARESDDPNVQKFVKKYDSLGAMEDADVTDAEPVDFSDWRGYSTELGDRLAQGNLPGDVYQAVKHVKNAVDEVVGEIAARNGASDLLDKANEHYRNYMHTFYDKPGAVAAVLDRVGKLDPEYYGEPFITGKSAGLGQANLARYSPELADLAKSLREKNAEFKSIKPADMKTAPLPEPPAPIENPSKPVLEAAKQIPNPEAPVVDPRQVKSVELQKIAQSLRGFRRYDAFILANSVVWSFLGGGLKALLAEPAVMGLKMAMGKALTRPGVVEWLTKPMPEDIAALNKLPKAEQTEFGDNLKAFVDKERADGHPVDVSPAAWPEAYRNAPATLSNSGQGGANYTADDLAKFKAKHGIKEEGAAADLKAQGEAIKEGVSVPVMITKSAEAMLKHYGYTQEQINAMTPQEAYETIVKHRDKGVPPVNSADYVRERDEPKHPLDRRNRGYTLEELEKSNDTQEKMDKRAAEKKRMEKEGEQE